MKKIIIIIILFTKINIVKAEDVNCLENLTIENYDINFNKSKYVYDITIDKEKYLNINYELSNDDVYVSITGNGNFNKDTNVIKINVDNNYEYIINVHKSALVSLIENNNIKEKEKMSNTKKEIIKLSIVIISCILIFSFYYFLFINKTVVHI